MIADEIIETVAGHRNIKPAIEELVAHVTRGDTLGITSATCEHTFICDVRGRRYDVRISLEVAGQKKVGP